MEQKKEPPKQEPPKYEAPKYEPPQYEMPKYEQPEYEMPKHEMPEYDAPKYEMPKYEAPKYELPKHDMPAYQPPKTAYQPPKVQHPKMKPHKMHFEVHFTKEKVKKYVGTWVHCHSIYGMHEGIVHRVLHDGIILVHHTQLASGQQLQQGDLSHGVYHSGDKSEMTEAQFLLPAPGLFVPYGGLYGVWPRPFFPI